MELTLESAFSTGGLVGHTSYLLLVVSMLMRNITLLRLLVIASAIAGISYDWFWLRDPVGVFWESTLIIVNLAQLGILYWQDLTAKFNDEETLFRRSKLPGLAAGKFRTLLNKGKWITLGDDYVLTRQGEPVSDLYYIADGFVEVSVDNKHVSQCGKGDFIGEMTIISNDYATATTTVKGEVKAWQISGETLSQLFERQSEIKLEMEASFARNYRDKLVHSNHLIAQGIIP